MRHATSTPAITERRRVAAHIARAERSARATLSRLTPSQRLVRTLLLDELARYRSRAVFPKNRDFPAGLRPSFVDAEGTRCAMAHLLEFGGEGALVGRIASERNHAYVRELADEPRLVAWLTAAGITLAEAAAIQPSYGCYSAAKIVCTGHSQAPSYRSPVQRVMEVQVPPTIDASGTVEYQTARGTVVTVWGDPGTYAAGGEVEVHGRFWAETTILLVHPSPQDSVGRMPVYHLLDQAGTVAVTSVTGERLSLTKRQFAEAVLGGRCEAYLGDLDERWTQTDCGDGCRVAHPGVAGGDPTTAGVLAAVLGALVMRRGGRRARR